MKGLILKDLYMAKRYFRIYFVLMLVFCALSFVNDNAFISAYPMVLMAMVPINLLAYDENFRWDRYCCALPCSRAQCVSAKYLIVIIFFAAVLLLTAGVQLLRIVFNGGDMHRLPGILVPLISIGLTGPALSMPVIFKFGVNKGRIVSMMVFGALVGILVATENMDTYAGGASAAALPLLVLPVTAVIFALSWLLSIYLYKKREL